AIGRGAQSQVFGGMNLNAATGRDSTAQQQVLTMGGAAGRGARNQVLGGHNLNAATGKGSFADQQVVTIGAQ
ncbi:hypothetical protein, partial [Paracraurococcus ruber]